MSFKLVLPAPDLDPSWPDKIRQAVPGVDVKPFADPQDAVDDLTDAWRRFAARETAARRCEQGKMVLRTLTNISANPTTTYWPM
jgi:hypothetical protein